MMENTGKNGTASHFSISRIAQLLIALAAGAFLGVVLYPRLAGPARSSNTANPAAVTAGSGTDGAPASVVQISPASQAEVGIAVEPAAFRTLQSYLPATGVVSEDPARVAHVRTLARGLIDRIYIKLGDRVPAGGPLVEYDNIELGLAIGDYQGAQAELRRCLTDLAGC